MKEVIFQVKKRNDKSGMVRVLRTCDEEADAQADVDQLMAVAEAKYGEFPDTYYYVNRLRIKGKS